MKYFLRRFFLPLFSFSLSSSLKWRQKNIFFIWSWNINMMTTMRRLCSLKSCINLVKNVFVVRSEVDFFWEGRPQGGKMKKCEKNVEMCGKLFSHIHIELNYNIRSTFSNKFMFFVLAQFTQKRWSVLFGSLDSLFFRVAHALLWTWNMNRNLRIINTLFTIVRSIAIIFYLMSFIFMCLLGMFEYNVIVFPS